jgi:hypothetical protein
VDEALKGAPCIASIAGGALSIFHAWIGDLAIRRPNVCALILMAAGAFAKSLQTEVRQTNRKEDQC